MKARRSIVSMNKGLKLFLAAIAVGAFAFGSNAVLAGPHHWGYDQGYGNNGGYGYSHHGRGHYVRGHGYYRDSCPRYNCDGSCYRQGAPRNYYDY